MGRKKINKVMLRRISEKAVRELNSIKRNRVINKVDLETSYDSEISEMMVNAPSWPKVRKELETLPKREDLR